MPKRTLSILSAVLIMLATRGQTAGQAAGPDLIQNGAFAEAGERGLARGWSVSGPMTRASLESGREGRACQKLETTGRSVSTLWQDVTVEPNATLYFTAWVKSGDRVVGRIGPLTMAYTEQGQWQQLVGLVRTGAAAKLKVEFLLGGLTGQPNALWVDQVTLRRIEPPAAAPPRRRFGLTTLVAQRSPAAHIVYPARIATYRTYAEELQQAIRAHTGVTLAVVSDAEATEAAHPVLKAPYRDSHLILLGRLGINRAMWPAYNRFLCASDGYYPGGNGFEVRTASNVLRNGLNHLILGGSTDEGAGRAVRRFVELLRQTKPQGDGSLTLPWLLDVELGGDCLAAFKADDARWAANPLDPLLPPVEPGYGTVRRWYHNAMACYWSGWPSYRQRATECLEPVLRDKAYTHHYIAEFLVRAYDMLDDSGLLTAEQSAAMDTLILRNFWDFLIGPDVTWMTTFAPPYEAIGLRNRHSIAPWMAELTMSGFLHDYMALQGPVKELVEFRRMEKGRFMRHLVTTRWEASLPGAVEPGAAEDIAAAMFRYALDHELYAEFFDSGNARRALNLDRISHLTGWGMRPLGGLDHRLMFGILASFHQDGRYLPLLRSIPLVQHVTGPFMGRYVNDVRRYVPGEELKPADPDEFTGVRLPPMMPHHTKHLPDLRGTRCELPNLAASEMLDFVAFRSGFTPDDDYVALTGLSGLSPAGVFLNFNSLGTNWLAAATSDRYCEQNAVSILRTDRWLHEERPYSAAARRDWAADFHRSGGVGLTLDPFMGAAWRREVLWLQPGLFVVRDTVQAKESGQFQISVNWRPAGLPEWDGAALTCHSDTGRFRITPLGREFRVSHDAQSEPTRLSQTASLQMTPGQSVTATTVLQAFRPSAGPAYAARLVGESQLVLSADGADTILVTWGPQKDDGIETDAKALVISRGRLQAIGATRLRIGAQSVLTAEQPVNLPGLKDASLGPELMKYVASVAAKPSQPPAASAARQVLEAQDKTAEWKVAWTYDGLLRPTRVRGVRRVSEDVVDLGKVVELAEIRAVLTGPMWQPTSLPEDIRVALPDERGGTKLRSYLTPQSEAATGRPEASPPSDIRVAVPDERGAAKLRSYLTPQSAAATDSRGAVPPLDSPAWRTLTEKPQWRPTVHTGNYGRADPVAEGFQVVRPKGVKARYVQAKGAADLIYYDAAVRTAGRPLRLEIADADRDGSPEVLVAPHIWPPFVRRIQEQDDTLALLRADGREVRQFTARTNLQAVRLLDTDGDGRRQVVALTNDARIHVMPSDGRGGRELDLYAMHQRFNATEGRPNTRQPAGGFTMPYAVGLWRRDAQGRAKMVVARYGALSFLDAAGQFEGVLIAGGYVMPGLLPHGVDVDGDGVDEQVCLARGQVFRVSGDVTPTVRDPGGTNFFPQVYSAKALKEPDWDERVDGAPVLLFEMLPWGGSPRYALIVRENYLGLYDAREHRWAFTWTPLVPLASAAIAASTRDTLRVRAVATDDLLWELDWEGRLDKLSRFATCPLPDRIRRITASPHAPGHTLLAGQQGLYLMRERDDVAKIAQGPFQDAGFLRVAGENALAIVAIRDDGRVVRLIRQ